MTELNSDNNDDDDDFDHLVTHVVMYDKMGYKQEVVKYV
jgi:hypothetical protein